MGGELSGLLLNHEGALGSMGGEEAHQLTEAELPQHLIYSSFSERHDLRPFSGQNAVVDIFTQPIGNDQPHNNMQPYMALNYMMKVQAAEDVLTQLQATIEAQQMQIDSLIALSSQSYVESNTNGFTYSGSGNHNAYITWSSDSNSWSYTSDTFPVNQGQIVILGYSQNINFCSNCQSGGIEINHHCFNSNGEEIPITSMGDFLTVLPTPGSTELHFETMVNLEMTMGNGWSAYSNFGFSMIRLQ